MKTESMSTPTLKRRSRSKAADSEGLGLSAAAEAGGSDTAAESNGASPRTRRGRTKSSETAAQSSRRGKTAEAEAGSEGDAETTKKTATRRSSSRSKARSEEGGEAEKQAKSGKSDKEKSEKSEKSTKSEKAEKADRAEAADSQDKDEKSARSGGRRSRRSTKSEKGRSSEKSDKDRSRSQKARSGRKDSEGEQRSSGRSRRRRRRGRGGQGQEADVELQDVEGILEIDEKGVGRLRQVKTNFAAGDNDPEVPKQLIERHHLRAGFLVTGGAGPRSNKFLVQRIDTVEGMEPEEAADRLSFMNLTVVDPDRRLRLETTSDELLTRAIDIIAPIGFGQRALIVAPPKTGKTIILQKIAKAVLSNYPEAKLMVLLIDERPEEVTDFQRTIGAEVFGSSSDFPAYEHLRLAELVMERARRLVEAGEDVVVLLDSITRLARAYNKEIDSSGRTLSGGVDSRALERPKRLFGAARNTEEAGSLTIVGTALVDTGSRMDEVIFEEFKGTGNMEIVLDRQLAEKRLWPAINVNNSGTRKEEKIFSPKENEKIRKLRQYLSSLRPVDAMEKLLARLRDFDSNEEFFTAL